MNIFEWLRERREQAEKKRKQKMRDRLARILWKAHSTDNQGLLLRMLIDMPDVTRYDHQSGGMKRAYCDVTMSDGYTLCGSDIWGVDAVKKAIYKVVQRLKAKHGLLQS